MLSRKADNILENDEFYRCAIEACGCLLGDRVLGDISESWVWSRLCLLPALWCFVELRKLIWVFRSWVVSHVNFCMCFFNLVLYVYLEFNDGRCNVIQRLPGRHPFTRLLVVNLLAAYRDDSQIVWTASPSLLIMFSSESKTARNTSHSHSLRVVDPSGFDWCPF